MVKIKKGDFVEVEYTGKTEGIVFDTTDEKIAKENDFHNKDVSYGPIVICIGEKHIIPGLDKRILGKNIGEYDFEITPEEGFGKKSAKLLRLIPITVFRKQNIQPMPGLQVNIDGLMGIVKTPGSRVIVDFNHPLAGKELEYHVKVNKLIEDLNEKIKALVKIQFGLKDEDFSIIVKENTAEITLKKKDLDIPEEIQKVFKEKAVELTKIKDIKFIKAKE